MQIQKSSDIEVFKFPEVRKKIVKSPDFYTWFLMCSQNIKRWLSICISYLVYSQIGLNIIRDDCHFGYKQKFFKKKLELPILVLLLLTGLIPEPITLIYIGSVPGHMKLNHSKPGNLSALVISFSLDWVHCAHHVCRSRSDFVLFTTTRQSILSPARQKNSRNLRERSPYNRGWRRVAPSSVVLEFTMSYLSLLPYHINKRRRHTFCHRICRRFYTATLTSQGHASIYLTSDHQLSSSLQLKVISSNLMWNCFLI